MKRLLPLSHMYLRDSNQVLDKLGELGRLPPTVRLFTAKAQSMYTTNIDTHHALASFDTWFKQCPTETPAGFRKTLFFCVLELVMTCNIFQFDDMFWLQVNGTAMATSLACMHATVYYALHEQSSILPTFGTALQPPCTMPSTNSPASYQPLAELCSTINGSSRTSLVYGLEHPPRGNRSKQP